MAYTVTLLPGDHRFVAGAHESLLDAALRAGVALDYGCSNGNCGLCRATLLAGSVNKLRPHDLVISRADRQAGQFLMCCYAAGSDVVLETRIASSVDDIPLQQVEARIRRVETAGQNTLVLHCRTPRSRTLRFIAGQHARLQFANGLQRELPIASCPCDGMNLEFHVYRDAADSFSDYLFTHDINADKVLITGPVGNFTLDEESRAPILLIAWEAGFGPVHSLIEHCLSLDLQQPIHLYWVVHHSDGHYADGYCRAVADAIDNFTYTPLCVPEISEATRRITLDYPDLSEHRLYIAMPPAVAEQVTDSLSNQGLQPERVKIDPLVA